MEQSDIGVQHNQAAEEENVRQVSSEIEIICKIRDLKESDRPFVISTFLNGLYYGNNFFNLITDKNAFMSNYKLVVDRLLNTNNVVIACLKDNEDVIVGYSVLSPDFLTIHWVYVKKRWRKQGLGRMLLPKYPTTFTHFTTLGLELSKKFNNIQFNPFDL